MILSASLRYRQAVQKARIISRRNLEAFMRGDRGSSGPPGMDIERTCIIKEIARAYEAGRHDAAKPTTNQ